LGSQVLRKILFGIYGGMIGAAYVLAVNGLWPMHAAIFAISLLLAVILMTWFAVQIATRPTSNKTDRNRCFAVAIVPMALGSLVFVGFVVLVLLPIWLPIIFIERCREDRRLRSEMERQGRFARADDLEAKLAAGHGTLIEAWGSNGVERIWYTDDDVRAQGSPAKDWDDLFDAWKAGHDHAFNASCRQQYLDRNSGKAVLTTISPSSRRNPLATRYPRMAIVRMPAMH
jgi:hypothetical protein